MAYHVVEFHADGGQMCVLGRRVFTDPVAAKSFADEMRSEPGHNCGPESVCQYESETDPGRIGDVYRGDMTPEKYTLLAEAQGGNYSKPSLSMLSMAKSHISRFFGSS